MSHQQTVEPVHNHSHDHDHDHSHEHNHEHDHHEDKVVLNRAESKARKAMQKLGLKQIPGIIRATIKKNQGVLFVISKPDVFKSSASETYVIFGEAKIEDANSQPQVPQFEQEDDAPAAETKAVADAADDDDAEVDESGVDPKDVQLVMTQSNVSRAKAVAALKNNENDVVNAIMELTM
ncbi:hypothetical protein H257_00647 [Aphanomyces astaci]|uniref:NAC-A/B domain-containing protein n=2 Tax=Aphanomyces astaci TaxID=112090 RepID=W4HBC4_APHAT|nr:hypothetical protein H257_00647 [Aphanomyces astaci]ETV89320.1 hypothetical protein H257_00647 [Aphanomyces astaci]|eukprot:XP_009821720.1 hypothetical protein H257_00647 [Aphanomyces astaci]